MRDLKGCLKILDILVERYSEADVGVLRWMGGSAVWRRHPPIFSDNLSNPSTNLRMSGAEGDRIVVVKETEMKEGRKEGRQKGGKPRKLV